MKTAESLGYTLGLFRSFQKEGIFEIGDNSKRFSDELTDEEVFEYLVYLELHLLGLKPAALKRISSYFHRYAMEGAVESFRENSWGPSGTRRIFELVESGKTCFILVDHTGVLRIFEDEMFFATFMKG